MSSLPARVRTLTEEVAAAHGAEVVDVTLSGGGRGRVLDVVVDSDEPLGSEQTARLAKELSRALDELDPIRGAYTLQVGTPGLDRPLRTARDFRRQLGREVQVVLRDPSAGGTGGTGPGDAAGTPRTLHGVVHGVADDEVILDPTGRSRGADANGGRSTGGELHHLPLDGIDHGKVVLPW